jgi:hypothetical protein
MPASLLSLPACLLPEMLLLNLAYLQDSVSFRTVLTILCSAYQALTFKHWMIHLSLLISYAVVLTEYSYSVNCWYLFSGKYVMLSAATSLFLMTQ